MSTKQMQIDPAHQAVRVFDDELTADIWRDKYRFGEETHPYDSHDRVASAIYAHDSPAHMKMATQAMHLGLWMPGGRINAGAGTGRRVTLINCYVNIEIEDDMTAIMHALRYAAVTMQQGGGIGTDFSTLRPSGALLRKTGAIASGPLPFMNMWHSMCGTIKSAGARRGAMMGTLVDTHPDLEEFVKAKQVKGRLTNFNMSILVSDAFMDAIRNDESWHLYFNIPKADGSHIGSFIDDSGVEQFIYKQVQARELWDLIIRNTFDYSEPGIIFIDRINDQNNLKYCELIRCTNPCGEQPLPPYGACCLGAANLARMVKHPFTLEAEFDWDLLRKVVRVGIRFLDNVLDETLYPLPEQEKESMDKRRIGLGISGLADALAQLEIRYGSREAETTVRKIMRDIAITAYDTSADLAKEKGTFGLYDEQAYMSRPFVQKMPERIQKKIKEHGIRNGVLLTIAPVGTGSLYYGNITSGLEPSFAHTYDRKVLQPDGSYKVYEAEGYAYRLYKTIAGSNKLPDYMVTIADLQVEDHVRMQAACQEWVDSSISKTINCSEDIPFEMFREVYEMAYQLGCKGCTTYRPSDVRGSVLSIRNGGGEARTLPKRPDELDGTTYKVKWPTMGSALYVTINNGKDGRAYEMFISSRSSKNSEWMVALSLMVSAHMRLGHDINFIPEELKQIVSAHDAAWVGGVYYGSLVAYIASILANHLARDASNNQDLNSTEKEGHVVPIQRVSNEAEICPQCDSPTLAHVEGCDLCSACGFSTCG